VSFEAVLDTHPWEQVCARIQSTRAEDVRTALGKSRLSLEDLAALLSPAAEPFLEEMAQKANALTRRRFGRVIQMYAPLYLSNECTNACVYCGFSRKNEVQRRTLSPAEALEEANLLIEAGFRHILLVSGESPRHVDTEFLAALVPRFNRRCASVSIEVQPLSREDYALLIECGVDGLVSYQETYNREVYAACHPAGPKRDFTFRLETADRGGAAGFRRVGIGALLGLSDWRVEGFMLGLHAAHLQKRYWRTQVTVSFPRLRPSSGGFAPPHPADDKALVQLLCSLRLLHPDCGLVLSTRERPELRDHLLPLGITQMSAGSRTEPGGYAHAGEAEGQFEVHDRRSPAEVAGSVTRRGYEPVWKDWDSTFLDPKPGSREDERRELRHDRSADTKPATPDRGRSKTGHHSSADTKPGNPTP
jgi:2-iminoacetate synthase